MAKDINWTKGGVKRCDSKRMIGVDTISPLRTRAKCVVLPHVKLNYVGTLAFGSLPSFEQFSVQQQQIGSATGGRHSHFNASESSLSFPGDGYVNNNTSAPGKTVEARTIKWQQKIGKPNIAAASSSSQPLSQPVLPGENVGVPEDPTTGQLEQEEEVGQFGEVLEDEQEDEEDDAKLDQLEPESVPMPATRQPDELARENLNRIFTYIDVDLLNMKKGGADIVEAASTTSNDSQFFRPRKVAPLRQQQQLSGLSNGYDPVDEHLLCQVTLQNERLLKFVPDLGSHPIKTRHGNYSYTIEVEEQGPLEFDPLIERFDESLRISKGENEGEEEGDTTQQKYGLFDLPEAHMHWMHYFINIEEELPADVQAVDKDQLNGRSQLCYSKGEGRMGTPLWACPSSLVNTGKVLTAGGGQPTQSSGNYEELYLGQAVDLKNLEFAGSRDANEQWSKIYSKVGLCTEGSGTLKISIQCLHQNRQFIASSVLRSLKYGTLMQRIGMSGSMHWRIMKVLNEFEHAKQQLLRLRTKKMHLMKFNE
uniref:Uncharacterized protein n=1 Tax=Ditylenchus dipsaci TaxID=166011 RepID=A0A915EFM0_9BILA